MKEFRLSKETINRLKSISKMVERITISRELFITDTSKSCMMRTRLIDIPDDFSFRIANIMSFLNIYNSFDDPIIDYSELEELGTIKIKNNTNSGIEECFTVTQDEKVLQIYNRDISDENQIYFKLKDMNKNSVFIENETINKMLKFSKFGNDAIVFKANKNKYDIVIHNTKFSNSNTMKFSIPTSITVDKLSFLLSSEIFLKLESTVDNYTIDIYKTNEEDLTSRMMIIYNDDQNIKYFCSNRFDRTKNKQNNFKTNEFE